MLNCYGKNSIAYGKVQVIRVKGNLSGKINVRLYSKKTGGSWVKKDEKTNISANSEKTITVKENISKTRYWRVTVTGTFMGNPISRSAYSGLLNKKGVKYPVAYEVYTKRLVAKPSTELKVDRTSRDPKFRKNYITWFEKKYPKANVDWSKYEIHHIRPLKYGGSNKISNGIAITIAQHKKLNTWWQNY